VMTDGPEDAEALKAAAADWFVRVHSDAAGESDWLALESWLAASPSHRVAMDAVEALWSDLDEYEAALAVGPKGATKGLVIDLSARRRADRPARSWWPWAVAASIVLALSGAWLLRLASLPPPQAFATAKGETRAIVLADGSRVLLNSASRIVARVDHRRRGVTLDGGEAIFDIAKDREHPFTILVGDQRVTVVGTQFDILRYDGAIAVTVSRGVVEVQPARAGIIAPTTRLIAGEQLRRREGAPTSAVAKVPIDEVFAWRNGYVVYRGRTLAEVASDLNRYFAVPVEVEGPAARLSFSGALVIDNEDAVIDRLRGFLPIKVVRSADRITISSK